MKPLRLKSPAKVNLFFRVLNKRPDGYHDIASLYHAIDFYDHVTVSLSNRDAVTCSDLTIPTDHTNLVYKARDAFRLALNKSFFAEIDIEKAIPAGAGLGGGSSNAATVLWALNELTGHPFNKDQLCEIGAELGSDVPFFFSSGSAYCTGRGEIMLNVPSPQINHLSLVLPGLFVATPKVYSKCIPDAVSSENPDSLLESGRWVNDLEPAAMLVEPKLAHIKSDLEKQFSRVVMSGSGSAFVCEGLGSLPIQLVTRTAWY